MSQDAEELNSQLKDKHEEENHKSDDDVEGYYDWLIKVTSPQFKPLKFNPAYFEKRMRKIQNKALRKIKISWERVQEIKDKGGDSREAELEHDLLIHLLKPLTLAELEELLVQFNKEKEALDLAMSEVYRWLKHIIEYISRPIIP